MPEKDVTKTAPVDWALYNAVCEVNYRYAELLDTESYDDWLDLFAEDSAYQMIPLENYQMNLPIAAIRCESRGMIADRLHAAREYTMAEPRSLRHFVSNISVTEVSDTEVKAEANLFVTETMLNRMTSVLLSGRYYDRLVRTEAGLKFASRDLVYDSIIIPNSIVAPL